MADQYNPIDRYNKVFILYEDLLEASQEITSPPMEAGYPLTNMDLRDPNVVARITGAGTAVVPKMLYFDLGEEKIIDSVAIVAHNIQKGGGVSMAIGLTGTGPWSEYTLFNSEKNILANPGFDDFNSLTPTDPAPGTIQANHWFVASGTPILRVLAYQPDTDGFYPPEDASNYVNKIYGKFLASSTNAGLATLSQYMLLPFSVGKHVRGSFWISTKGVTYQNTLFISILELNGILTPLASTNIFTDGAFSIDGWRQITFDVQVTSPSARYFAIYFLSGAYVADSEVFIDNCVMTFDGKDGESYTQFIQPQRSGNLFKHFDHPIPARHIKFYFVGGSALVPSPDAFIEFGRILIGQSLVLGAQRGASYSEDSGDQIQLTTGGSPIEIKTSGINKSFKLSFKRFKVGEVDDILEALQQKQGDQLFLSMFHETKRERAMLGHINPPIQLQESSVKNFIDLSIDFTKEGQ